MPKRPPPPELTFQQHVADFLVREHGYGVLEQPDICDTEHCIAEDQLWAFLKATQSDSLQKLADDYGTDVREEVFRALRREFLASRPFDKHVSTCYTNVQNTPPAADPVIRGR